jgi:hypothetical protein
MSVILVKVEIIIGFNDALVDASEAVKDIGLG